MRQIKKLISPTNPVAVVVADGTYKRLNKSDMRGISVPQTSFLVVGSRVMLTINLSLRHGLINGSVGIVRRIIYFHSAPPDIPYAVLVEFDNYNGPTFQDTNCVALKRTRCNVESNIRVTSMINIPLRLAHGYTIHKAQGMTLDRVVIDIGPHEGASLGLTYVALSRVRRLDQLLVYPCTLERLNEGAKHHEYGARKRALEALAKGNILKVVSP